METLWRPGGAGGAPRRFHHKILWVTYRSAPLPLFPWKFSAPKASIPSHVLVNFNVAKNSRFRKSLKFSPLAVPIVGIPFHRPPLLRDLLIQPVDL